MSVAQYLERTVDVLAFQGPRPGGEKLATQELVVTGNGGQLCTGVVKLAQRVLIVLFTEKGSMPYAANRGCELMTELRLGLVRNTFDLLASFSAAMVDIRQQLTAEEAVTDPDDERLESCELVSASMLGDKAVARIAVTSRAGGSAEFIVPLVSPI